MILTDINEHQLIIALKKKETQAGEQLIELYGHRLLRSAYLLCGHENSAQDLVQETFIQALKSIHLFQEKSTLYTWLHGILLNKCRRHHRHCKKIVYTDQIPERIAEQVEDCKIDCHAMSGLVAQALAKLSGKHREIVVLRYYEGLKISDIAIRLGITKGTVKSRLHYATRQLRKLLPAECNYQNSQSER